MSWILPTKALVERLVVKGVTTNMDEETKLRVPVLGKNHKGRSSFEAVRKLNNRIRALHRKGKSQKEIMKRLQISRTTVWEHLNGRVKLA